MKEFKPDKDADLNEVINALDWDITPQRDLWPDISTRIKFANKDLQNTPSKQRFNWSQLAVAACFVMACAALVMSSLSYYRVTQTHQMQATYMEFQKTQIALMEQQHAHVRSQFVAMLDGELGQLNDSTVMEIKSTLMTFDEASEILKRAILEQPFNTAYPGQLARTYQQELKLLNKYREHYKNDKTII